MTTPVSIIIPAYNAATTLQQTIDSVFAQTVPDWEVILVNDGSQDDTPLIVQQLDNSEARIRAVNQTNQGVSAARNTAIQLAQHEWLLFLDADDFIAPHFLEKMTVPLNTNPDLDMILCRSENVTTDGVVVEECLYEELETLFVELTRRCPFNPNACLTCKSLVQAVGGFDMSLKTCEDWDLWQRIIRSGAKIELVKEVLAYHRLQPSSLSTQAHQLMINGSQVIERGHRSDPRVPKPHLAYANGEPSHQQNTAKLNLLAWSAGLMLGSGDNPLALFDLVSSDCQAILDPYRIAYSLFYGAVLPISQPRTAWTELWFKLESLILDFLKALEQQSQTSGLAQQTQAVLENLVREYWLGEFPVQLGKLYATRLEISEPLPMLTFNSSVERFHAEFCLKGKRLEDEIFRSLVIPVQDRLITPAHILDTIATQHHVKIVRGRVLGSKIYSMLLMVWWKWRVKRMRRKFS